MSSHRLKKSAVDLFVGSCLTGSLIKQIPWDCLCNTKHRVFLVDGGIRAASRLPQEVLRTAYWLGDLDSVPKSWTRRLRSIPKSQMVVLPKKKAVSDGEAAFDFAKPMAAQAAVLVGMMGGRLDHFLANIMKCFSLARTGPWQHLVMLGHLDQAVFFKDVFQCSLPKNTSCGILSNPIGKTPRNMVLEGFEFNLQQAPLMTFSHGIGNRTKRSRLHIRFVGKGSGAFLVHLPLDKLPLSFWNTIINRKTKGA